MTALGSTPADKVFTAKLTLRSGHEIRPRFDMPSEQINTFALCAVLTHDVWIAPLSGTTNVHCIRRHTTNTLVIHTRHDNNSKMDYNEHCARSTQC